MSIIDDALSAAKTVGRTVGKKTEELLIISKLKLNAIELENKLSNQYEKLGKIAYRKSVGELEDVEEAEELADDEEDIIEEINELSAELEETLRELEELK